MKEFENVVIYQDKNNEWRYFNFDNNKSGDSVAFMQEFAGMNFMDAVNHVSDFIKSNNTIKENIGKE